MVTIRVTQEHIVRGKRADCGKCPVALAVLDSGFQSVRVDGCSVQAYNSFGLRKRQLPLAVEQWVCRFDFGAHVEPFEFNLDLDPDPVSETRDEISPDVRVNTGWPPGRGEAV